MCYIGRDMLHPWICGYVAKTGSGKSFHKGCRLKKQQHTFNGRVDVINDIVLLV